VAESKRARIISSIRTRARVERAWWQVSQETAKAEGQSRRMGLHGYLHTLGFRAAEKTRVGASALGRGAARAARATNTGVDRGVRAIAGLPRGAKIGGAAALAAGAGYAGYRAYKNRKAAPRRRAGGGARTAG
jgi:hypothetical protein